MIERTATGWRRAARLIGGGETGRGQFGRAVTLSGDGSTAIVSGLTDDRNKGAAWLFLRSGAAWAQNGSKFRRGVALFGPRVAISPDGGRALISGSDGQRSAAWLLVNPPTVLGVNPHSGPVAGGTRVTIVGRGFTGPLNVRFGSSAAASFVIDSPEQITAVSPAGPPGPVDVTVGTSVGTSAVTPVGRFTYVGPPTVTGLSPSTGPASGGTTVVIAGTNLAGASLVRFGGTAASFKVDSSSQITAVAPPGQPGTVAVTVTTPGGTSGAVVEGQFTYTTLRLISFDDIVTGGLGGGSLVSVASRYASQGVTFSNASAVDYSKGDPSIPGFAHSGTIAVEPCVGAELCTSPLRGVFSGPQLSVRVWVGFSFKLTEPLQIQLRAYDGEGVVVATASATLPARSSPTPISVPLEVRRPTRVISSFEVRVPGGYNNAVAVDDVSFEG